MGSEVQRFRGSLLRPSGYAGQAGFRGSGFSIIASGARFIINKKRGCPDEGLTKK